MSGRSFLFPKQVPIASVPLSRTVSRDKVGSAIPEGPALILPWATLRRASLFALVPCLERQHSDPGVRLCRQHGVPAAGGFEWAFRRSL